MTSMDIYYVYAYLRSKDSETAKAGTPYYIGKGKNNRAWGNHGRIKVPKDKSKIIMLESNLTEDAAFSLEKEMIKFWGRKSIEENGILMNICSGGEGFADLITAKNANTGEFVQVTKEEFNKNPELVGVNTDRKMPGTSKYRQKHIAAKDKFGNNVQVTRKQFDKNPELVGINSGKSGLWNHINLPENLIKCEVCGKSFNKGNYNMYHGPQCGKDRTKESTKLRRERLKIESELRREKIPCETCGKVISKHHMNRHISAFHPNLG